MTESAGEDAPSPEPSSTGSTASVARSFFTLNIVTTLLSVVTGVIAARTLAPVGRGDLAAILVPVGLAPFLLSAGLPTFASRSSARQEGISDLLGTVGGLAVVIGLAGLALGLLIAPVLANGNTTVQALLTTGFLLLPVTLLGAVAGDIVLGRQLWRTLWIQRFVPPAGTALGYVVLLVAGRFTVLSAAICAFTFSLLSMIPIWKALSPIGPLHFRRGLARRALVFGMKAWPVTLSQILNHRLDQLVMVRAVPIRELGLYAVAVTVTSGTNLIASAVGTATYPRVAAGADILVLRTVRVTLGVCLVAAAAGALASPWLIPAVFGAAFRGAVPLTLILFAASVPLSGAGVLASCLAGGDRAGAAGLAEIFACGFTILGLAILLPSLGAMGASIVSLVAYSVNFIWLLVVARSRFGGNLLDYLVPSWDDVLLVVATLRPKIKAA